MDEQQQKNYEAWGYLDQALFTSSHVKAKDIEMGSTDWDNVYPTSPEEIDRMEDLIQQAQARQTTPTTNSSTSAYATLKRWCIILVSVTALGNGHLSPEVFSVPASSGISATKIRNQPKIARRT